jgi:hypothetical protein
MGAVASKFNPLQIADPSGLAAFGGSRPSLFPHGHRREERLTSRLISTLEIVRPFALRFFDAIEITGRRPTTASRNLGGYLAHGIVEPRLNSDNRRADAALSLRYGTREPWRCAFEVKYLTEGPNSRKSSAKLTHDQVEWTYSSAKAAAFDHVITISADQPDGSRNPSRFEPSAEDLQQTGLSHLSWLKIVWILKQTRTRHANTLSAAEDRILADFESYLLNSNIWKHARKVSLGGGFASVRRHCRNDSNARSDESDAAIADVSTKWLQLAESVAQRISIETGILVHANGTRPNVDAVIHGLLRSRTLQAQFKTESPADGHVTVEVDLVEARITTSWEVDIARRLPAKNPQSRTRWTEISLILESWTSYRGQVTVFGAGRSNVILPATPMRKAGEAVARATAEGASPRRLLISRSETANVRGKLRGDTLASIVERTALGMAPWK